VETGPFPVEPDPRAPDASGAPRPDDQGSGAWWEDGRGWGDGDGFEPYPRRRRSPIVRIAGLVAAVALVLGTVGTTLEIVLGSRDQPELPVSGVSGVSAGGVHRISFTVMNDTATTVLPACTLELLKPNGTSKLGSMPVPARAVGPLAPGTAGTGSVVLSARLAALASRAAVRVTCTG